MGSDLQGPGGPRSTTRRVGTWPASRISVRDFAARKWIALRLRVAHTRPRHTPTPGRRSHNGTKMDCIALARCTHTPPTHGPRSHNGTKMNCIALARCTHTPALGVHSRTAIEIGVRDLTVLVSRARQYSIPAASALPPQADHRHERRFPPRAPTPLRPAA